MNLARPKHSLLSDFKPYNSLKQSLFAYENITLLEKCVIYKPAILQNGNLERTKFSFYAVFRLVYKQFILHNFVFFFELKKIAYFW